MTKEESIAMWKVEKAHTDKNLLTKKMNKLFDLVEELIMNGDLMYDQFSGDMLDEVTTTIIENGKNETNLDRAAQIDLICERLYEKYTKQHNNSESGEGDNGVLADNTEVSDESGVCTSDDTSIEHTTNVDYVWLIEEDGVITYFDKEYEVKAGNVVMLMYRIGDEEHGDIIVIDNKDLTNYYERRKKYYEEQKVREKAKDCCCDCDCECVSQSC